MLNRIRFSRRLGSLFSRKFHFGRRKLASITSSVISRRTEPDDLLTYEESLQQWPSATISSLTNGLRTVTERTVTPDICTIGVWVDGGSRYEMPPVEGSANFFERLVLKSTLERTGNQLAHELENIGAIYTSFTEREAQAFYCKCHKKDISRVMEVLSTVLQRPEISDSLIDAEKQSILRELDELEDNNKQRCMDYLHGFAYQDTPLANSVIGTEENVIEMDASKVQRYFDDVFRPPRICVVGTGDVDHDEVHRLTETHFSDMDISYKNEIPLYNMEVRFTAGELRHRHDDHPLCHGAIAIELPPIADPDAIAFRAACELLGRWDLTQGGALYTSNRLGQFCNQHFDSDNGCHSFEHFNLQYRDTGLWGVYLTMNQWQGQDFPNLLIQDWMRMCNSVTEGELEKMKHLLRTNLFRSCSNNEALANQIGRQMILRDERIHPGDKEYEILTLTLKKLQNAFYERMYNVEPVVSIYGRCDAWIQYESLKPQFWQLRM